MYFNSLAFAAFFTVVFLLYWFIPGKYRTAVVLASSLYFYASYDIKYVVVLLAISTLVFFAARELEKTEKKNTVMTITVILLVGVLFVFKYLNFTFELIDRLIISFPLRFNNLLLPVGISFYIFEAISYIADIYRGKIKAEENFFILLTYLSFFPTISSGPIERAGNLIPQIKKEKEFDYKKVTYGIKLFAWGLYKKIVIADNFALYVDKIYNDVTAYEGFVFVIVAFFYMIQIYCDFSGYSDMAVGVGNMLGFDLTQNFKAPYFSTSIKEFWSKWHISLSTWLKDYVYIPLGGNRCGKVRHYLNLVITFLVSGLWHGACLAYVAWGLMHGLLQVIENALKIKAVEKKYSPLWFVRCFIVLGFLYGTWILFRAGSLGQAWYILKNMFPMKGVGLDYYFMKGQWDLNLTASTMKTMLFVYLVPLTAFDFFNQKKDVIETISGWHPVVRYLIYVLLILVILFMHAVGDVNFVYFKF